MALEQAESQGRLQTWASEGFFPEGYQYSIVDFSRRSQKYFSKGTKSGKILFYPLEIKKLTFFARILIGKMSNFKF